MPITQTITLLPTPPDPLVDDSTTFSSKASTFTQKLVAFGTEMNTLIGQINAVTVGSVFGDRYIYDSATTAADPTTGKLRLNNATPSAATALYISETDADLLNKATWLATWDDNVQTLKGLLRVIKASSPTTYADYQITGTLTDNGTWDTFTLTYIGGNGSFTNGDSLVLQFQRYGADGASATFTTPNRQIAANTTLTSADNGNEIEVTVSGVTVTADTPANLGNGFTALLIDSAWDWTLSGTFSDGSTSKKIMARTVSLLQSDGAGLRLVSFSDFGFRNKIRNGKMEVAQRGTSFAWTATGFGYTLDGWRFSTNTTTGAFTVSQNAAGLVSTECQYNLRVTVGTVAPAPAAGAYAVLSQPIEGFLVRDLIGNPIAIRFEILSPKSGQHYCAIQNSNADRSYVLPFTVTSAGVAQTVTVSLPTGLITAGTWNWTTGVGAVLMFPLVGGTTFQTASPNQWVSASVFCGSGQQNLLDNVANVFAITAVQLEKNNAVTPLEHIEPALELVRNWRYARILGEGLCGGWVGSTTAQITAQFSPPMRAAPSAVLLSTTPQIGDPGVANYTGSGSALSAAFAASATGAAYNINGFSSGVQGRVAVMLTPSILVSAEL